MNIRILIALATLGALVAPAWATPDEEVPDGEILLAVLREIRQDDGVSSHAVGVASRDGVIMLDGTVHNLLARDRAAEIARGVKGVRAVVNKIDVRPVNRPDGQIMHDVEMALAVNSATESFEIDTAVKDGVVTLSGRCDSWDESQIAIRVAKSVRGVKKVVNRVIIDLVEDRPDGEIRRDVEHRLDIDVRVDAYAVEVDVEDGKVRLRGTVGSAAEKWRATSDAWVAGTESVDAEQLDVEPWAHDPMIRRSPVFPTDEEIREAVRDAFFYDTRVASFNPRIVVDNGSVTLLGKVGSLSAKRAAQQTAQNTIGVRRVRNLLTVELNRRQQSAIEGDVKTALKRDPYVERHEIRVAVVGDEVFLNGVVDSDFEKAHAEAVAAGISGVTAVQNTLQVINEWTWRTDGMIREDVQSELYWSPFVDSEDVTVIVVDGVVTLRGTVDDWSEYRAATENAWEGDPRSVLNKLRVRGWHD